MVELERFVARHYPKEAAAGKIADFLTISLRNVSAINDRAVGADDWTCLHALMTLLEWQNRKRPTSQQWPFMKNYRLAVLIHLLFQRSEDMTKVGTATLTRLYFPKDRASRLHMDRLVIWFCNNFASEMRSLYGPDFLRKRWHRDLLGFS